MAQWIKSDFFLQNVKSFGGIYLFIPSEKTFHIISHVSRIHLTSQICIDWIAQEVVGDLVGSAWANTVMIRLIPQDEYFILTFYAINFSCEWPHISANLKANHY